MATFEGLEMNSCPKNMYDFSNTWVVVVSGSGPNFCGHMILCMGNSSDTSIYVHVAGGTGSSGSGYKERSGLKAHPKWMKEDTYNRYLQENNKIELRRFKVQISRPEEAMRKLEHLLSKPWSWWILPHNCVTFVEAIVQAGGNKGGLITNCPAWARPSDFE